MFLFIDAEIESNGEVWSRDWKLREFSMILDDEFRLGIGRLHLCHGPNGISFEYASTADVREEMAGRTLVFSLEDCFNNLFQQAKYIIGHSVQHDCKIARWVYNDFTGGRRNPWSIDAELLCTMELSTPICKFGSASLGWKWPKLIEAYQHLVDPNGFDGQHTARADALACRRLFYALLDGGHIDHLRQFRRNK